MPRIIMVKSFITFKNTPVLLSGLICLMKFCYHRKAFEWRDVLRAGGAALRLIVVIVCETMISLSNTWGAQLLHSLLGFCLSGLLCGGKCSVQLVGNNKPRWAAFIPHHLSKDGVTIISAPCEACFSGKLQNLLSPGWARFISPFY